MIIYGNIQSIFSVDVILRIVGGAAYKAVLPAFLSVIIYLIGRNYVNHMPKTYEDSFMKHPNALGALISGISFILIFRANHSYGRYWEAAQALYKMMSKWLDACSLTSAFHYQSESYSRIKPPTFFDNPKVNFQDGLRRRRQLGQEDLIDFNAATNAWMRSNTLPKDQSYNRLSNDEMEENRSSGYSNEHNWTLNRTNMEKFRRTLAVSSDNTVSINDAASEKRNSILVEEKRRVQKQKRRSSMDDETSSMRRLSLSMFSRRPHSSDDEANSCKNVDDNSIYSSEAEEDNIEDNESYFDRMPSPYRNDIGRYAFHVHGIEGIYGLGQLDGGISGEPSLFLQELCHLASLLNAVALSTLRCGEDVFSPLIEYDENDDIFEWPSTDGSDLLADRTILSSIVNAFSYWLWLHKRTTDGESLPLDIIGGVSQEEIDMLQKARGGSAKVNLCWFWLIEFITREHLAGSTGNVSPPIISRIHQCLSDGNVGYNSARKIAFIPFPFPHAQVSLLALILLMVAVPFLVLEYTDQEISSWFGTCLTFAIIEVLFGLHEVARELESPFENVPNHLPLRVLQAQFNQSLFQLFSGFHPNSFWNTDEFIYGDDVYGDRVYISEKED